MTPTPDQPGDELVKRLEAIAAKIMLSINDTDEAIYPGSSVAVALRKAAAHITALQAELEEARKPKSEDFRRMAIELATANDYALRMLDRAQTAELALSAIRERVGDVEGLAKVIAEATFGKGAPVGSDKRLAATAIRDGILGEG